MRATESTHAQAADLPRFASALLLALRPRQWTKNGLLFVALAFTLKLHEPELLARASLAVALFCALSSAGYLLNDVMDVEADRFHPTKRFRPIASGIIPVWLGLALGATLALVGVVGALLLSPKFAAFALGYLVLTGVYSVWLKHMVLLDVFGIAAGFVLRAAAGAAAIDVPISPWLYTATMFGALLIALGKRRAELVGLGSGAATHRRNLQAYSLELLDQLILVVSGAALITYAFYSFSAENLPRDHSMMLTIPVVLYGLFRYLLVVRNGAGAKPEDLLLTDRPLLAAVAFWAVLAVAILYTAPLR
jgi:4-hydroxybenzoate polyprenyltransferase